MTKPKRCTWVELTQDSQLRDRYTVKVQNRFEILQGRASVETSTITT